jgi:hypothetical protein
MYSNEPGLYEAFKGSVFGYTKDDLSRCDIDFEIRVCARLIHETCTGKTIKAKC